MIPGSANPLLLAAAAEEAGAYQISRSVRLNSADSAYLSRTPASAGNRKTWTFSCWIKRSGSGSRMDVLSTNVATSGNYLSLQFSSGNAISLGYFNGEIFTTSAVYRDFSAWMHVVLTLDTTLATAADRVKLYVNGSRVTTFSTDNISSVLTQNSDQGINAVQSHSIGRNDNGANVHFDGYLADIHLIDGQALDPTSFGEFDDNGVWQPKEFAGEHNTPAVVNFTNDTTVHPNVVPKIASGSIDDIFDGNTTNGCQFSPTSGSDTSTFDYPTSLSISRTNVTSVKAYVNGFAAVKTNFQGSYSGTASTGDRTITVYSGSATTLSEISFKSLKDTSNNNRTFTMYALEVTSDLGTEILTNDVAGVNGFHLPFSDNSTAAALGTDTSGAGNNWTVNNLSVTAGAGNDSLVDTPTNAGTDTGVGGEVTGNYCTLNPLESHSGNTLSNGNLDAVLLGSSGNWLNTYSTFRLPTSSKWYFEVTPTSVASSGGIVIGLVQSSWGSSTATSGAQSGEYGTWYRSTGEVRTNGTNTTVTTYAANDVIGVAYDASANTVAYYKNNSLIHTTSALQSGIEWKVRLSSGGPSGDNAGAVVNFGARAFSYQAPSGFKALCTANLPEPQTITTSGSYTGNGVADGPFVYLNGVPTAMTVNGNAITFGTHADKLSNGFKIRTTSTTYNQNASTYNYSITSTGDPFKIARAQANP